MERDKSLVSKETSLRWLRHQPHCRRCLAHDNSYLFPAWYDLSRKSVERLASMYEQNYPEELQQPLFFANGDREMSIRLPRTHDVHQDSDGEINMDTLEVQFSVCTRWPEDQNLKRGEKPEWEKYNFNLSAPQGWEQMLQVFPQEKRT